MPRRVEHEQREEDEVEEVERRDAEQLGADDALPRIQRAPAVSPPDFVRRAGRLVDLHPLQEERRPEKRDGVGPERVRPAEQLDEQAADAVAGQERERAAAVDERVRLDVVLARHEHLDHRAVRDVEEDAQRPGQEGDDVELRPGQVAERVGDRDRADQQRPADVGREHHVAGGGRGGRPRRRRAARRAGSGSGTPSSARPSGRRVAWRARTAVSGSAIAVIWSPSSETDWPMKKRRKLGFVRRSGGSTAGRHIYLSGCGGRQPRASTVPE